MLTKADIYSCIKGLFFLPIWYYLGLKKRNPRLWIFGAWYGNLYSDNSRAVFEYVNKECKDIRAVWITRQPSVYDKVKNLGYEVFYADSKEGKKICQEANWAFTVDGVKDLNPKYLKGVHHAMLWHGMPLKYIGEDEMLFKRNFDFKKKILTLIRRIFLPYEFLNEKFDFTISNSSFFNPYLKSAFKIKEDKIVITGAPRNDSFFKCTSESLEERIREKFPKATKIIYMPTFRDAVSSDGLSFDPFSSFDFDIDMFNKSLEDNDIVFIYKGHYVDSISKKREKFKFNDRFVVLTNEDVDDLYAFIGKMDILMTDYSSIYFDFVLMNKPVILAEFDREDYKTHSRPFYFDYNLMEGNRVESWQNIVDLFYKKKEISSLTKNAFDRFNEVTDGKSSEKIVNFVLKN